MSGAEDFVDARAVEVFGQEGAVGGVFGDKVPAVVEEVAGVAADLAADDAVAGVVALVECGSTTGGGDEAVFGVVGEGGGVRRVGRGDFCEVAVVGS
jgi:hypothetical protein